MNMHPCSEVYLCNECGYPTEKDMPICQTCLWDMPSKPTSIRWAVVALWLSCGILGLFVWMGVYILWKLRFLGSLPTVGGM